VIKKYRIFLTLLSLMVLVLGLVAVSQVNANLSAATWWAQFSTRPERSCRMHQSRQ